jgi:RimJ/RimL family protein N-acetyltransferase
MIETKRLILRRWVDADRVPFHAACNDPNVMKFLGPLQSLAETDAAIDRLNTYLDDYGYTFWALERREDGAFLGFTGLKPGPSETPLFGQVEIGWRLATEFQGQGYAHEAAAASIGWGWANLPDDEILAMTVSANAASWGLMERLGMVRRPELDFDHPALPADSSLRQHIVYSIARPV